MKAKRKSLFRRLVGWIRNLILAFFVLSLLAVVLYKYMPVYVTPLMLLRVGEQLWRGENARLEHRWVPLDEISPALVQAVVASEDNLFLARLLKEYHILTGYSGQYTLRLLPALTITRKEADEFLRAFREVMEA